VIEKKRGGQKAATESAQAAENKEEVGLREA
jgi:hypothetical protein